MLTIFLSIPICAVFIVFSVDKFGEAKFLNCLLLRKGYNDFTAIYSQKMVKIAVHDIDLFFKLSLFPFVGFAFSWDRIALTLCSKDILFFNFFECILSDHNPQLYLLVIILLSSYSSLVLFLDFFMVSANPRWLR